MSKFDYPEEVEARHMEVLDAVSGISLDRLRELAAADREGRVVIAPYKAGTKFAQPDDPNHEFDMTFTGDVQFCVIGGEESEYFSPEDLAELVKECPVIEAAALAEEEREMRLIDADALIAKNENSTNSYDEYVRRVVGEMPTIVPATNWTPCSEGLPDETDKYWVTIIRDGEPEVDKRAYYAREKYWGQGAKPIAWMPQFRPQPWTGDHIVDANKKMEGATDGE